MIFSLCRQPQNGLCEMIEDDGTVQISSLGDLNIMNGGQATV
jgi:hypothetical protein